jgi:hypothetical protein
MVEMTEEPIETIETESVLERIEGVFESLPLQTLAKVLTINLIGLQPITRFSRYHYKVNINVRKCCMGLGYNCAYACCPSCIRSRARRICHSTGNSTEDSTTTGTTGSNSLNILLPAII